MSHLKSTYGARMSFEKGRMFDHRNGQLESDLFDAQREARFYKTQCEALETIVDGYCTHAPQCILSHWSAGRPTSDGGYETQYLDKWYQTKPINKTPKCTCGLDESIDTHRKAVKAFGKGL